MTNYDEWQSSEHDGEPRDQERDLADGYWAEVGPDNRRSPDGWSWTVLVGTDGDVVTDGDADSETEAKQAVHAWELGATHGRAGTTPYGDLDADDSALMTALGETSPTTEDNHPRRLALLEAYRDAYQQAREG